MRPLSILSCLGLLLWCSDQASAQTDAAETDSTRITVATETSTAPSTDPAKAPDRVAAAENEQRNWSAEVAASVNRIRLFADPQDDQPLTAIKAYQWANPARPKVRGERICLLYLVDDRPVASCKIYPTGRAASS